MCLHPSHSGNWQPPMEFSWAWWRMIEKKKRKEVKKKQCIFGLLLEYIYVIKKNKHLLWNLHFTKNHQSSFQTIEKRRATFIFQVISTYMVIPLISFLFHHNHFFSEWVTYPLYSVMDTSITFLSERHCLNSF